MSHSILFLDDNETLRNAGRRTLEHAGYSIFEADAGHRALDLIRTHQIDLVIADIDIPDLNSLELLRTLKESHPSLKVIAMSEWFDEERTFSGATTKLSKPFSQIDLLSAVEKVISEDALSQ